MPRLASPAGFTLVELVVALILLALAVTLAAPLLRAPAPVDPVADVVARARRLAVARAEPLTLSVLADGRWRVESARGAGALAEGRLPAPQRAASISLSPLGACVPAAGGDWDPTRCAPAGAP